MNQYVCDRCGHRWQGEHVQVCLVCGWSVINLWTGDGAEARAKAQALRIRNEYEAAQAAR